MVVVVYMNGVLAAKREGQETSSNVFCMCSEYVLDPVCIYYRLFIVTVILTLIPILVVILIPILIVSDPSVPFDEFGFSRSPDVCPSSSDAEKYAVGFQPKAKRRLHR